LHAGKLIFRNALRAPGRTLMTVLTVGIMLSAFVFPRAMVDAQRRQVDEAEANRLVVHPRRGWGTPLPLRYADELRQMKGVRTATGVRWAGFGVPGREGLFFASFGVEPEPFLDIHAHQLVTSQEQREAFVQNPHGALISRDLAEKLGWKLGEHHIVQSAEFPGDWDLEVMALYETNHADWARNSLWLHYDHLNRGLPIQAQGQLAFVVAELFDPGSSSDMAKAIDLKYDATPARTLALQDRLDVVALVGRFHAILAALDGVSYFILLVVVGILVNVLAMNVRERTRELGVLRAIGFGPRWVVAMVLAEAALIGLAGAGVGLAIAYPLLEGFVGPALQERMEFPPLIISSRLALWCVGAGCGLAMLSASIPAYRILRLSVVEALGRVK
jgi:putative ABC transport system permease protein